MPKWSEVTLAAKENRCELVLAGNSLEKKEDGDSSPRSDEGLDERIFHITTLNFLKLIKFDSLTTLPSRIGLLVNMSELCLAENKLTSLPAEISALTKLKFLDVSYNQISEFPSQLSELASLQQLNAAHNKLVCLPELAALQALHILNLGFNELDSLPDVSKLSHLHTLICNDNQFKEIPAPVCKLQGLKHLNFVNNSLKALPLELSQCAKLKELLVTGNKLSDRRLLKLVEQCLARQVLDYLEKEFKKLAVSTKGKGKGKKKGAATPAELPVSDEDEEEKREVIRVIHHSAGAKLQCTRSLTAEKASRPYIVLCIVHSLDLHKSTNMFKRFIKLQTDLHEDVCQQRRAATIATHHLRAIEPPLRYTTAPAHEMTLQPLFRPSFVSAEEFVSTLLQEAHEIRKQKKRNQLSGIHKYLELVQGVSEYPCLIDASNAVISFPPITNCEKSKISADSTSILLEVTSPTSWEVARSVMSALVSGIISLDCCSKPNVVAVFEQVRVCSSGGDLHSVFPSRTDLQEDQRYKVEIEYGESGAED